MMNFNEGWQPISEYDKSKYDWVLVKYFDGVVECVPQVAELRDDGKWHVSSDASEDWTIPFEVRYFFDMQQLDNQTKPIRAEENQKYIKSLIGDAMKEQDRSVSLYLHPDGDISVCIYPYSDKGGE